MLEEPYYSLVRSMDLDVHYTPDNFYTEEHSVPSRSEYDRRIYRSFATAAAFRQSHQWSFDANVSFTTESTSVFIYLHLAFV